VRQRLRDLHHLLARDRQLVHAHTRVEPQVQAREEGVRVLVQPPLVEPPAAPRLAADEDVLRRGQVVHQVEFLMDDADAQLLGGARARDVDGLAIEAHLAAVFRVDAGEDLHQRGLAGAVLAHQRVHLVGQQLEVHLVEHTHGLEGLAQVRDRDQRGRHAGPQIVTPPSTSTACPVTKRDSSLSR
jgi:hypothetical protein